MSGQLGTRKRVERDGENYYIIIGDDFLEVTVPFENRPDILKERSTIDWMCKEVTKMLKERSNK